MDQEHKYTSQTEIVTPIIKGARHEHYDRTIEIAKWCKMVMTGEGQRDYLVQIRSKESEKQKLQRIKLFNSPTPFAINPVQKDFERAHRVDGITQRHSNSDSTAEDRVNELTKDFYGSQSLIDYQQERLLFLVLNDPNAYLHYEQMDNNGVDGKRTTESLYPVEIPSSQVVGKQVVNGDLEWLVKEVPRVVMVGDTAFNVSDFYLYERSTQTKFTEILEIPEGVNPEDVLVVSLEANEQPPTTDPETGVPLTIETKLNLHGKDFKKRMFVVYRVETSTNTVPMLPAGFLVDPITGSKEVFVPVYYPAKYNLTNLMREVSYFEIDLDKQVFNKTFAYGPGCNFEAKDGAACDFGLLDNDIDRPCPKCHGAGVDMHVTDQDVVVMKLPESKDEFYIDLEKLSHTEAPNVEVSKWIYELIQNEITNVSLAVFNSQDVRQPYEAKSATEIVFNWDEKNEPIYKYGKQIDRHWMFAINIAYQYLGKDSTIVENIRSIPADLKIEPLRERIAVYSLASQQNLPIDVMWPMVCGILDKIHRNEPEVVKEVKAWEEIKPWRSKSSEEIAMILQGRANDDPQRMLHENMDWVRRNFNIKVGFLHLISPKERLKKVIESMKDVTDGIIYTSSPDLSLPLEIEEPENVEV